jgi:hypothetical protein
VIFRHHVPATDVTLLVTVASGQNFFAMRGSGFNSEVRGLIRSSSIARVAAAE